MTTLVTGGTGYLGSALVRILVEDGKHVRVLARPTSKTQHLEELGVEIARGDILDPASIQSALQDCDVLYHAAALYDLWGLDKKELMRTECEGTRNVLEAAQQTQVDRIVYTSTAVVIGERKNEVGTETTEHRGYFLSAYERAKFEADRIVRTYLDQGLPIVTVNPTLSGFPTANTMSPTCRFSLSAIGRNGRSFSAIFKTATSVCSSLPTIAAANSRPSFIRTRTSSAELPCSSLMTWWFVSTYPSAEIRTPEPMPWRILRSPPSLFPPGSRGSIP